MHKARLQIYPAMQHIMNAFLQILARPRTHVDGIKATVPVLKRGYNKHFVEDTRVGYELSWRLGGVLKVNQEFNARDGKLNDA